MLQRLGLPGENGSRVPLEALDRDVIPDHLTAIFVAAPVVSAAPELNATAGARSPARRSRWLSVGRRADAPSLARYLLEEAYEVSRC